MARQLIRYNAIRRADSLDDQLAAATIAARESTSLTQEDLQEGVLSQLKRILVGDDAGGWDSDFINDGIRPLKQLGADISAIDRVIIRPRRTQVQASVAVPANQNWVALSATSNEVPSVAVSLSPGTEGAVAAQLASGEFGANRLTVPSEDSIWILVDVADATTGEEINDAAKNQPIRGILQVKNTASDGALFDNTTNQAQLSFVVVNPSTMALEAATAATIGGKSIRYAFAQRQSFRSIPTAGFLIDGAAFVDGAASVDVTRQNAYELGPLASIAATKPHRTELAQDGSEVAWRISGVNALRLLRDDSVAGDILEATVDRLDINNATPADFQKGLRVDTADVGIDIGVTPGKIARLAGGLEVEATGGSLTLDGSGGELALADSRVLSPIPFSSPGNSSFSGPLVGQPSILAAINRAATVGGVDLRVGTKEYSGSTVPAGNNVPGGGFFDFTVSGIVFFDETNIPNTRNTFVFVNGVLERNGNATTPHDVRLGVSAANGDLMFTHPIRSGDVIVAVSLIP
jgi:hypothetical protein